MKNIQLKLLVLFFIALFLPHFGSSQESSANKPSYDVHRIYPPISLTKEELKEAYTLIDLNTRYKTSWIREYVSVEILTSQKGKIRKAMGKNDTLSQEQKDLMNTADLGTDISVKVQYIPENTLTHNDPKEISFTVSVEPEHEATYPGGKQQLKQYLMDKAISKIPEGSYKDYDLTAINFTISEKGEIIDAHVFGAEYQTSKNEKIEQLLLETIRNMPCWKPAAYVNGPKVKQNFVLTVGSMENCMLPLLNIRREKLNKNK